MSMSTTHFNVQQVLALLVEVVRDAGRDHAAKDEKGAIGCIYIQRPINRHGRLVSVCIIGRLFDHLGILRALLRPEEHGPDQYGACGLSEGLWVNAETFGVTFSDEAKHLMHEVQQQQDNGLAWGDALRKGMEAYVERVETEARQKVGADSYWWRQAANAFPEQEKAEDFGDLVPQGDPWEEQPLAPWEKDLLNNENPF